MIQHPTHPGEVAHLSVGWVSELVYSGETRTHVITYMLTTDQQDSDAIARIIDHDKKGLLNTDRLSEYDFHAVAWLGALDAPAPRTTDFHGVPSGLYTQEQRDQYTAINDWFWSREHTTA